MVHGINTAVIVEEIRMSVKLSIYLFLQSLNKDACFGKRFKYYQC